MDIRIPRRDLAAAVATAAHALPHRPPVPVMAGLRLTASADGRLEVAGFDYEVSTRATATCSVDQPGQALVSGRLLADITKALPDQTVHITTEASRAVLTCGRSRFTLWLLPIDEFPALPELPGVVGQVDAELWAAAIAQTAIAAGRDDTLPVLTGIRVEVEGDKVVLAATDRYRFAVRELLWKPEQAEHTAVALVPAKTLHETARSLAGAGSVDLALSAGARGDGLLGLTGPDLDITTRLLEGEFPKFRALFPTEFTSVATVPTGPFAEAVRRVALVAERNTPIRLNFTQSGLVIEAGSGDDAQAVDRLDADLEGDDISIAFNPAYLLDGLTAANSPVTQISFVSPTKPALLQGKADQGAEADDSFKYLIMPVRLSG
ncbi:DNA polymerase III subunit beta [Streptacidiphilus sp. EB129]|uniref:DNA polymerase III subunit beta n=1 Tax=Streptacidiphilus sp. EB129 TaxID=3156262 RepID=UPI003516D18F